MAYTIAVISAKNGVVRYKTCVTENGANLYYDNLRKRFAKRLVGENECGFIYAMVNMYGTTFINVQKLWVEKRESIKY